MPPSSPEPERIPADEVEIVDEDRGPRWVELEGGSLDLVVGGSDEGAIRRLIDGVRESHPRARVEVDSSELILRGRVTGGTPESRMRLASEAIAEAINDDMRVRRERAQALAVQASIDRAAARVRALLEGPTLDP